MLLLKVDGLEMANLIVGIVGALATIIGLGLAMVLGVHEAREFRREATDREANRRAEQEAQERAQAERVSAVAHVRFLQGRVVPNATGYTQHANRYAADAEVFNASALPIYDVKVVCPHLDGRSWVAKVGFIPGGQKGHVHLPDQSDDALNMASLEVAFRDAGDRWWTRCADGHLERHDTEPYPFRRPESATGHDR